MLETGAKIKVLTTDFKGIGIDTQEDLDRANKVFELEEEKKRQEEAARAAEEGK